MQTAPQSPQSYNRQDSPTLEQLADRFAAQAVKSAMAATPDGLDALTELARTTSKPTGSILNSAAAAVLDSRGIVKDDEPDRDFPFRVLSRRSDTGERRTVGHFARYIEAEVCIHSALSKCTIRGTDSGRFWGTNSDGESAHYWVESPQLTASVSDEAQQ